MLDYLARNNADCKVGKTNFYAIVYLTVSPEKIEKSGPSKIIAKCCSLVFLDYNYYTFFDWYLDCNPTCTEGLEEKCTVSARWWEPGVRHLSQC